MKYAYSLFLLLGAYLLYTPTISQAMLMMLLYFIVIALLGMIIEYFHDHPKMKYFLHHWF